MLPSQVKSDRLIELARVTMNPSKHQARANSLVQFSWLDDYQSSKQTSPCEANIITNIIIIILIRYLEFEISPEANNKIEPKSQLELLESKQYYSFLAAPRIVLTCFCVSLRDGRDSNGSLGVSGRISLSRPSWLGEVLIRPIGKLREKVSSRQTRPVRLCNSCENGRDLLTPRKPKRDSLS